LWPLRLLRRDDGAHVFERKLIGQNGRVATYLDARRRGPSQSPLLELLAEDAHRIARATPIDTVVPARKMQLGALVTLLACAALLLFVTLAPGFWGHGSRHRLFGAALPSELVPVRNILVLPGDATVRRNSDLEIRASLQGFQSDEAAVFVRFADQQQWERAPMERVADSRASFAFKLYALRSPFKYYVESDGTRSAEHTVAVADLPRIDRMRLTYRYPEWTGLPTQVEEGSRDIRAVAGTQVDIEIQSDVPLENPTLVHDDGEAGMTERNGANAATLAVEKPGRYYIAAEVAGEKVALSEEYAIEIVPDEKPVVQIERPARDWRATNIE